MLLKKPTFDLLHICTFDVLCEFLTVRPDDDLIQFLLQTADKLRRQKKKLIKEDKKKNLTVSPFKTLLVQRAQIGDSCGWLF